MYQIKTPEDVTRLLQGLKLSDQQKLKLYKDLANNTRKFFRGQIKQQRDIHGIPYAPRRRRKPLYVFQGKKIFRQSKDQRRNMLSGISKMLMTQVDSNGFQVGLGGVPGLIAKVHNEGEKVFVPTRMNGWFNRKNNRWEGGRKSQLGVRMPKRTFIGWTPKLEQEAVSIILQALEPKL